jgi:hypothetical protein
MVIAGRSQHLVNADDFVSQAIATVRGHRRNFGPLARIGPLPLLLFLVRENSIPVIPICFRNRLLALAPTIT